MILTNCRLIKELSSATETGLYDVVLEDGRINEVTAAGSVAGENVVDCGGKTLLPGLIDLHTHVSGLRGITATDMGNPMKALILCADFTQHYLDYGFTTIRDCGSFGRISNHIRDMYAHGLGVGPDIISSGRIITPTEEELADSLQEMYSEADGPWEMKKAVRREMAEKADFIKTMASGSAFDPHGIPTQSVITREELTALVEAAAMKSTYVAAHAHSDSSIRLCVDCGVHTIEHATYISDETIEALSKAPDCYLVPTLAAMYVSHPDGEDGSFWIQRLGAMLDACAENIRKAYLAGMKLGFGTDSTVTMDQYEQGIEFRYRKELCGMKDVDILLQATKYSAEIAGMDDQVGTIVPGKKANLILVDGKPEEDISCMYGKPMKVWKDGRLVRENMRGDR
jgi:imidazolonepropionase-like amidohydrolase